MHTKIFRFQTLDKTPVRTYELILSSDISGYSVRIFELSYGGKKEQVHVPNIRYEIAPATFYRARLHYRGYLLGMVMAELRNGIVHRPNPNVPAVAPEAKLDSHIRANLDGWPSGYPEACDDDLLDGADLSGF